MIIRKLLTALALTATLNPLTGLAQVNNVVIDGLFDDWADENTIFDSTDGVNNVCDDQPGQKDVTAAGIACNFDTTDPNPASVIYLGFLFDETSTTGNNTMDGCWLLNADGIPGVEQALCFTLGGSAATRDPAVVTDTRYFTCNNSTTDTCAGPTQVTLPASVTCLAGSVSGANIINSCPPDTEDRGVECEIAVAEFPIAVSDSTVELLQSCSYPSEQPNSAGSDCVIGEGNPWEIDLITGGTDVTPLPVQLQTFSVE